MIDIEQFRQQAHHLVDWMADYFQNIRTYPVKSQVHPGDIFNKIPDTPPSQGESIESIFDDFKNVVIPGITHWQHPNFHAFFTGNSSYPSVLAEMLTATLAAQCMLWETSPAAAELEEKMMDWLKQLLALPKEWEGVIQDTASTATLVAILTAREWKSSWRINEQGFNGNERFTLYCSSQAHSSVGKAVRIAGLGLVSLRKIEVDDQFALIPTKLEEKIKEDVEAGFTPLLAVATIGTTGTTAIDPVSDIGEICNKFQMWMHVDAAWAGPALMLPEYQWMASGLEKANSFVFNPHKWLFTNFDCSAYFVKDAEMLRRTFTLIPEYLKTGTKGVNNYSDWGIQLGRRFRALKLWFVIRNFGSTGLRQKVSDHIEWAKQLAVKVDQHPDFQLMAPAPLSTVCFRYHPDQLESGLNDLNRKLLDQINQSGLAYLTHTRMNDDFVIRLVVGQTYQLKEDIDNAWEVIQSIASELNFKN